jgi:hypothetical protein
MENLRKKIIELENEIEELNNEINSKKKFDEIQNAIDETDTKNKKFIFDSIEVIRKTFNEIFKSPDIKSISKDCLLNYIFPFIKQEFELNLTPDEKEKVDMIFEKSEKKEYIKKEYVRHSNLAEKNNFIKNVMKEEVIGDASIINPSLYDENSFDDISKKFKQEERYRAQIKF